MKLFGLTFATAAFAQYGGNGTFVPAAEAAARLAYEQPSATCYKCEGSSYVDCIAQANAREGGPISCRSDKMCSITERRRGGDVYRVEMRCKQDDVCRQEVQHNLRPCPQMSWVTECHQRTENVPSVCRKCFAQSKDIDYINGFIDAVRYADYMGDTGLHVDNWMSED